MESFIEENCKGSCDDDEIINCSYDLISHYSAEEYRNRVLLWLGAAIKAKYNPLINCIIEEWNDNGHEYNENFTHNMLTLLDKFRLI